MDMITECPCCESTRYTPGVYRCPICWGVFDDLDYVTCDVCGYSWNNELASRICEECQDKLDNGHLEYD